ncbi:hypothetical protein BZA05DRAFT_393189 [Tricharina praecox]|uniref:uncharacterized protein n=1 Tax=Tricharina praecox TaxID=43433 RepID=UPI00221E4454|nr:uncharacterized protein BZA05DRAFT_393189 [Tricharina praecox]KAI5854985.1 hypothetical protein BZA05DRAFT_393189 [Tricharina praecox]
MYIYRHVPLACLLPCAVPCTLHCAASLYVRTYMIYMLYSTCCTLRYILIYLLAHAPSSGPLIPPRLRAWRNTYIHTVTSACTHPACMEPRRPLFLPIPPYPHTHPISPIAIRSARWGTYIRALIRGVDGSMYV